MLCCVTIVALCDLLLDIFWGGHARTDIQSALNLCAIFAFLSPSVDSGQTVPYTTEGSAPSLTFSTEVGPFTDVSSNALVESHIAHSAPDLVQAHLYPSTAGSESSHYTNFSIFTLPS